MTLRLVIRGRWPTSSMPTWQQVFCNIDGFGGDSDLQLQVDGRGRVDEQLHGRELIALKAGGGDPERIGAGRKKQELVFPLFPGGGGALALRFIVGENDLGAGDGTATGIGDGAAEGSGGLCEGCAFQQQRRASQCGRDEDGVAKK